MDTDEKDLDGLAYWMIPAVIAWDALIIILQAAILAHAALHKKDSRQADKETER